MKGERTKDEKKGLFLKKSTVYLNMFVFSEQGSKKREAEDLGKRMITGARVGRTEFKV